MLTYSWNAQPSDLLESSYREWQIAVVSSTCNVPMAPFRPFIGQCKLVSRHANVFGAGSEFECRYDRAASEPAPPARHKMCITIFGQKTDSDSTSSEQEPRKITRQPCKKLPSNARRFSVGCIAACLRSSVGATIRLIPPTETRNLQHLDPDIDHGSKMSIGAATVSSTRSAGQVRPPEQFHTA
jgi:hypothetical protein